MIKLKHNYGNDKFNLHYIMLNNVVRFYSWNGGINVVFIDGKEKSYLNTIEDVLEQIQGNQVIKG